MVILSVVLIPGWRTPINVPVPHFPKLAKTRSVLDCRVGSVLDFGTFVWEGGSMFRTFPLGPFAWDSGAFVLAVFLCVCRFDCFAWDLSFVFDLACFLNNRPFAIFRLAIPTRQQNKKEDKKNRSSLIRPLSSSQAGRAKHLRYQIEPTLRVCTRIFGR